MSYPCLRTRANARSIGTEGQGQMRLARLRELEAMAAKLSATARKLPSGRDRQDAFQEIANFRDKIAALKKGAALRPAQAPRT
jgi:hypothetical protein